MRLGRMLSNSKDIDASRLRRRARFVDQIWFERERDSKFRSGHDSSDRCNDSLFSGRRAPYLA